MGVVMLITLFTSRVVLKALGIEDFGIYSLIMGLSTTLIFFSSSLTNSIQRFLTYELAKEDITKVNTVFNTSLIFYTIISLLCFSIGYVLAPYIVNNYINVSSDKIDATITIFRIFVGQFSLTLIFSVYESVLIARENMKIYAYLGLYDAFTKLITAYLISFSSNKLIFYSVCILILFIFQKFILLFYCQRQYPESKIKFKLDYKVLRGIISLGGWSIYGSGVWMINGQGINYLFNIFSGPILNAAMGIANQVNNAINNFCVNFYTAVRPQIIKQYSKKEYNSMTKLINDSARYSLFLLLSLCLPILVKTEYILSIWLGDYPADTTILVKLILIFSIINSLSNPIWTSIMATNNVKKAVLYSSTFFLLTLPISYILLKNGIKPYFAIFVMCIIRLGSILIMIHCLSEQLEFSAIKYLKDSMGKALYVFTPVYLVIYIISKMTEDSPINLIIIILTGGMLSLLSIYFIGLKQNEKIFILKKITTIIHNIKR